MATRLVTLSERLLPTIVKQKKEL